MKFIKKLLVSSMLITGFMSFGTVNVNAKENLVEPAAAVITKTVNELFESSNYNYEYDIDSFMSFDIRVHGEYYVTNGRITGASLSGSLVNVDSSDNLLTARVTATNCTYTNTSIRVSVRVSYYYDEFPYGSETFILTINHTN